MSSPYQNAYSTQEHQPATIYHTASPERQQSGGLGIYACSMPPQQTVTLVASPQAEAWTQAPPMQQEYITSQPPDIFSAAIDPFSGWSTSQPMAGPHSPEAPGLEFCQTPSSSNMPSHRGSVSSYEPSDASERAYTPRTKTEEEWYSTAGNEHVIQRASTLPFAGPAPMPPQEMYRQPHEEIYISQPQEWSKNDTTAYLNELHANPESRLPRFDMNSMMSGVGRIKKKRQRTTPEEATHDCKICGKLFKRSYNWKSHMETHNPERKYPHPCTAMNGDQPCTKKFQRKTDLDRHFDSVHLKARNHKCPLCGNKFARRDTLRRHTEDGCPKRFELGIRDPVVPPQPSPAQWQARSPVSQQPEFAPQRSKSFSGPASHPPPPPAYPMYSQAMTLPPPPAY